ncbi:hypothetical protein HJFPF1_05806 [Paramyrothecium foliicola]|nr:hypothetical protein HJFPF1_05806 [Paramyrothecium foliicola]
MRWQEQTRHAPTPFLEHGGADGHHLSSTSVFYISIVDAAAITATAGMYSKPTSPCCLWGANAWEEIRPDAREYRRAADLPTTLTES